MLTNLQQHRLFNQMTLHSRPTTPLITQIPNLDILNRFSNKWFVLCCHSATFKLYSQYFVTVLNVF